MHQVERVTSTSQEGEESDIDSWPGDSTSPNDSKDQLFLSRQYIFAVKNQDWHGRDLGNGQVC